MQLIFSTQTQDCVTLARLSKGIKLIDLKPVQKLAVLATKVFKICSLHQSKYNLQYPDKPAVKDSGPAWILFISASMHKGTGKKISGPARFLPDPPLLFPSSLH